MRERATETKTRRQVLQTLGTALWVAPLGPLLACGGSTRRSQLDSGLEHDGGDDASAVGDASADGGGEPGGWASGGTASMTGDYPDPFVAGIGAACALTSSATRGPCYAETIERRDISEGQDGLPMRLAFLVVDETCRPVPDATVDIWHTSATGLYSGEDAAEMCSRGDPTARAARWFRGSQITDANGRVDFDSCFPGWYPGRTIHIHFTIRIGGAESVTSQLFFEDSLSDAIIAAEPLYQDRGARDTTNENDGVVSGAALQGYLFQTERMPDGAMLAWKAIIIRSA